MRHRLSLFLSACVLCQACLAVAHAANIIWVHQQRGGAGALAWEDDQWRDLLESNGHTILNHDRYDDLEIDEARLDELNAADLVLFSRDSSSGDYNDPIEQELWNEGLTAPLIVFTPYVLRNSRWNMMDGEAIQDALEPMEAIIPEHPIFAGVPLDANNEVEIWDQLGPDDHIDLLAAEPGNGLLIASEANTGYPWIVYWEQGQEFFDGAGWSAGGPRLYLSAGSDDDPNTWGEKNITPAGDQIVLNAVNWMTGGGANAPGDFNGDGNLDVADLDLLSQGQKANDLAYDLNGDGTTNLADRIYWANDLRKVWMGDANLDGEFNSGDLVAVFTVGKYESGQAADWSQGDWDGDMLFTSGDFVAAFANGGYEVGPRPAVAAVPEPCSLLLVFIGVLTLAARWK